MKLFAVIDLILLAGAVSAFDPDFGYYTPVDAFQAREVLPPIKPIYRYNESKTPDFLDLPLADEPIANGATFSPSVVNSVPDVPDEAEFKDSYEIPEAPIEPEIADEYEVPEVPVLPEIVDTYEVPELPETIEILTEGPYPETTPAPIPVEVLTEGTFPATPVITTSVQCHEECQPVCRTYVQRREHYSPRSRYYGRQARYYGRQARSLDFFKFLTKDKSYKNRFNTCGRWKREVHYNPFLEVNKGRKFDDRDVVHEFASPIINGKFRGIRGINKVKGAALYWAKDKLKDAFTKDKKGNNYGYGPNYGPGYGPGFGPGRGYGSPAFFNGYPGNYGYSNVNGGFYGGFNSGFGGRGLPNNHGIFKRDTVPSKRSAEPGKWLKEKLFGKKYALKAKIEDKKYDILDKLFGKKYKSKDYDYDYYGYDYDYGYGYGRYKRSLGKKNKSKYPKNNGCGPVDTIYVEYVPQEVCENKCFNVCPQY